MVYIISQLRTSSHQLHVETGRYAKNNKSPLRKICRICSTPNEDDLLLLSELPCFEPIIEDELHLLRTCPLYHDLRVSLSDQLKENIFREPSKVFAPDTIVEASRFLVRAVKRRFPKKSTGRIGKTTLSKLDGQKGSAK